MNLALAIKQLFPAADLLNDFLIRDDCDGNGPYIAVWNLPDPQPTQTELEAAWLEVRKKEKIEELNKACEVAIEAGFTSSITSHTYRYNKDEDQINLLDAEAELKNDTSIAGGNWKTLDVGPVYHTRDQLLAVVKEGRWHKKRMVDKYWAKKTAVQKATTEAHINEIIWDDITPPSAPEGLNATPGNTQVTLNWIANTEIDLVGYNVYQGDTQVNATLVTGNTYTFTGLTNGTAYTFTITAVDIDGNESVKSTAVTATPTV